MLSNSDGNNLNENTTLELDNSQNIVNETFRLENESSKDENYEYSLNFDKRFNDEGHKLVIDFQVGENTDNENSILTQNSIDFEQVTSDETTNNKLLKADCHEVKIIEDFSELDASNVSDDIIENTEDTMTLLERYVDELDLTLDKKRLKNTMKSLYNEAQDLEI